MELQRAREACRHSQQEVESYRSEVELQRSQISGAKGRLAEAQTRYETLERDTESLRTQLEALRHRLRDQTAAMERQRKIAALIHDLSDGSKDPEGFSASLSPQEASDGAQ